MDLEKRQRQQLLAAKDGLSLSDLGYSDFRPPIRTIERAKIAPGSLSSEASIFQEIKDLSAKLSYSYAMQASDFYQISDEITTDNRDLMPPAAKLEGDVSVTAVEAKALELADVNKLRSLVESSRRLPFRNIGTTLTTAPSPQQTTVAAASYVGRLYEAELAPASSVGKHLKVSIVAYDFEGAVQELRVITAAAPSPVVVISLMDTGTAISGVQRPPQPEPAGKTRIADI